MKKKYIILVVVILFLIFIPFYLYYENNFLQVSYYKVFDENVPKDFDGYKIIQISDFHNTASKRLREDLIESIQKEKPDMIAITGDLIDANKTNIQLSVDFVKKITDITGVYFVTGNHEASIKNYDVLKGNLEELGVKVLENTYDTVSKGASYINIAGINDPSFANEPSVSNEIIVKTEINNTKYNEDFYTVLLSHRPELYDVYVERKVNLVLTGHAHGGQIRIPIIGGVVAPNQGFFPRFTDGILKEGDTAMVISRGIGNSILPFRINNRPEMVIVELFCK